MSTPYEIGAQLAVKLASLQGFGDYATPVAGSLSPLLAGLTSAATGEEGHRLHQGVMSTGGSLLGIAGGGLAGGLAGGIGGAGLGALINALRDKNVSDGALVGGTLGLGAGGALGALGGGAYGAHVGRHSARRGR